MRIFHSFHVLAAIGLLVGLASSCSQKNASHCANREGDKTCGDLYDTKPFCSDCTAQNDGCVASIADEEKCHVVTAGDTNAETSGVTTTGVDTTLTTSDESITTHMSGSMSAGDTSTSDAATTNVDSSGGDSSSSGGGPVCGDGVLEGDELCEGDVGEADCLSVGLGEGGTLSCDPVTCLYDVSECPNVPVCPNGAAEGNEQCDGADLNEADCTTLGFATGTLGCGAMSCMYDTSACSSCGNDSVDGDDQCDGEDLDGSDCYTFGFDGGLLTCADDCSFDASACSPCGNGVIDAGEACDNGSLGGQDCVMQGYADGDLNCTSHCSYDFSECIAGPACGDGNLDDGEACDGSVNGMTCADVNPDYGAGGTLGCNDENCSFDESGCCLGLLQGCHDGGDCCSGACLLDLVLGTVCL